MLEWVKGHSRVEGNEGADTLAAAGVNEPTIVKDIATLAPGKLVQTGAKLQIMTQKTIHKGIRQRKTKPERGGTSRNLEAIGDETEIRFEFSLTDEAIWRSMRCKDITQSIRDYLWKSTHNALKIGAF